MSLPYFKFMCDDWLGGLICTHDMETQGVFVNLAARLWKREGYIDNDETVLSRVFRIDKHLLSKCLQALIHDNLVCVTSDEKLYIKFILTQLQHCNKLSSTRAAAGSKGGKAKGKLLLYPEPEPEPDPDLKDICPKSGRRYTQAQKRQIRIEENTEDMIRIGEWFGRRASTKWTLAEAEALTNVKPENGDLDEMEKFYTSDYEYLRRNVETLLNNWNGELDKARSYEKQKAKPSLTRNFDDQSLKGTDYVCET